MVRFSYTVYLEIGICALISLSTAFYPGDFVISLLLAWSMLIAVGLVAVLFYKGGPYLRNG